MHSWSDPAWLAEAHTWIESQLLELGIQRTAAIEQPHVQHWATVLRIPTAKEPLWFKANATSQAFEAGVVELLAQRRPDDVPRLLMGEGGHGLRELVEGMRDLSPWLEALPRYGELQLALAPDRDALLALGTPDRRLAVLPGLYDQLLEAAADELSAGDRRRLEQLSPWVVEACAELAGLGVPETIQHDDLHDGQVFVRDGHYLFFDWGDACVSHPFTTMSVTLEGVLSWGLDDVENSVDVAPFRDAYLEPFTGAELPGDPRAAPGAVRRGEPERSGRATPDVPGRVLT